VDTRDDPIESITPAPTVAGTAAITTSPRKAHAVSFIRAPSADEGDLDDEEWVDPTPIPATPLEPTPPMFPDTPTVPPPPMMAKAKHEELEAECHSRRARVRARTTDRGGCRI